MSNDIITRVKQNISFSVQISTINELVTCACRYPQELVHLPFMVRTVMKKVSRLNLLPEQKHELTVLVVNATLECKISNPATRAEFHSCVQNLVRVYYGLSKHDNVFTVPPHEDVVHPLPKPERKDDVVEEIVGRLTFQVDIPIVFQLVNCARQWSLTLITLPIVLREVMRTMSKCGRHISSAHKQELVVQTLSVLIVCTIADKDLHESLTNALYGLVDTYYALSKGKHVFRLSIPTEFAVETKCFCF